MWRRLISLNLCLLLLLSLFPAGARAEGTPEPFAYTGDRVLILEGPEGEIQTGAQAAAGTMAIRNGDETEIWYKPLDASYTGLYRGTLEDGEIVPQYAADAEGQFRFTVTRETCGAAVPVVLLTAYGDMEQAYLAVPAWEDIPEKVLFWRWADTGEVCDYTIGYWMDGTYELEFVLRDKTGDTNLLSGDLSCDGGFFRLEDRDDHSVFLYMDGFGTGCVSYGDLSLPVEGYGPDVGFFSQPEYDYAYYLRELPFSGEPVTAYLVHKYGYALGTVTETTGNGADFASNTDGTVVTVTLSAVTEEWLNVDLESEAFGFCSAGVRINDLSPHLVWRYADQIDWDRITGEPIYGPGSGEPTRREIWANHMYQGEVMEFLWSDGSELTPLTLGDLTVSGIAVGETVQDAFIRINYADFGEGSVSYTGSEIRVIAQAPEVGFYRAPQVKLENYVGETWRWGGGEETVYALASSGRITDANMNSAQPVTMELDTANGWAKLTLSAYHAGKSRMLSLDCTVQQLSGGEMACSAWTDIRDSSPALLAGGFRWETDPTTGERIRVPAIIPEEPAFPWDGSRDIGYISGEPGVVTEVLFWLRQGDGTWARVPAEQLEFSGDSFRAEVLEDGFVRLTFLDFGEGAVTYRAVTHELTVTARVETVLPLVGLYSGPVATVEGYMGHTWASDGRSPAYLVTRKGSLNSVSASGSIPVTVEFTSGDTWAKLTHPVPVEGFDGSRIWLDYNVDGMSGNYTVNITDARPGLVWRWADQTWQEGEWTFLSRPEEPVQASALGSSPGFSWTVEFLWRDKSGDLSPVNAADLVLPEGIVEMVESQDQFAELRWTGLGSGSINYASEGKSGSLPVNVSLPEVGFYSAPEATAENLMTDWQFTGRNSTVYIIARTGTLDSLTWFDGAPAEIDFTPGTDMAVVTLTELSQTWMNIRYIHTGGTRWNSIHINITDARPGLVWRWAEYDHASDTFYTNDWTVQTRSLGSSPGYTWFVEFLWRNASGELEPISIADLVMPEGVGVLVQGKGQYAEIRWIGFGSGSITYASEGKSGSLPVNVSLPQIGFYSAPERTEEKYISGENYHGDLSAEPDKTVYLVTDGSMYTSSTDLVIYDVRMTSAGTAIPLETEILESGRALRVTQTLDVAEDQNVTLVLYARSASHHETTAEINAWVRVRGHRQQLLLRRVLEPHADYTYEGSAYTGMGREAGETIYILPLLDPVSREPYTGELTCTEEDVVELELYDAEKHIWQVTFLSRERKSAFLTGTVDGETRYIRVNPGDTAWSGSFLFFDLVMPPQEGYMPDGPWSDNYTVVWGDSLLFQLRIGDDPVTGPVTCGDGVAAEEVKVDGLEGVYRISGLRPGWFTVSQGAAAANIGVLAPWRGMEFVPAKAPTETEPGNIAYFRDHTDGKLYAMPDMPYDRETVLTRAQTAQLVVTLLGWETEGYVDGVGDYADVDETVPERDAIRLLTKYGVMNGYENGTFHPGDPVTRAQLAKILCTALNITVGMPADAVIADDVPGTHWAAQYIAGMVDRGIIPASQTEKGWLFRPEEAAKMGDIDLIALAQQIPGGRVVTEEETLLYLVKVETSGSGRAWADTAAAAPGQTVQIGFEPSAGFSFNGWRIVSGNVNLTQSSFVMPEENVILEARWLNVETGISIDPDTTAVTAEEEVTVALELTAEETDRKLRVLLAEFTADRQFLGMKEKTVTVKAGETAAEIEAGLKTGGAEILRVFVLTETWVPLADYLDLYID